MIYLYILALVMKYWGVTREIDWLNIIGMNLSQLAYFFFVFRGLPLFVPHQPPFPTEKWLAGPDPHLVFVMPVFRMLPLWPASSTCLRTIEKKITRVSVQGAEPCLKICCQDGRTDLFPDYCLADSCHCRL